MEVKDNYKVSDKLTFVIANDFKLLQVMSRFGISLGFGDKTIAEVCEQRGIDPFTFVSILNFVKNGGIDNVINPEKLSLVSLLDYLKQTHRYFLEYQFPNMRRDMLNAIDCSIKNEVAFLVLKFFDEYVEEVRKHMKFEEEVTFKYVEQLLDGNGEVIEGKEHDNTLLAYHHEEIEDKLMDLKKMLILYYPQKEVDLDINEVIYNIYRVQEDLLMHCLVEDYVFKPTVIYQENLVRRQKKAKTKSEGDPTKEYDGELSEREKNIVVCVAKGMSNKEIADSLCISINTVTTHRRNIARKLSIHTPAGITIYAIVNKLVKLEEVSI